MNTVIGRRMLVSVMLVVPAVSRGAGQTPQQQTPEQPKAPASAPKLTTMETLRRHLQRFGFIH